MFYLRVGGIQDLGECPSSEELERLFRRFDTDNSGNIDFNEFVEGVADYLLTE